MNTKFVTTFKIKIITLQFPNVTQSLTCSQLVTVETFVVCYRESIGKDYYSVSMNKEIGLSLTSDYMNRSPVFHFLKVI